MGALLWQIWLERNEKNFQGKFFHLDSFCIQILCLIIASKMIVCPEWPLVSQCLYQYGYIIVNFGNVSFIVFLPSLTQIIFAHLYIYLSNLQSYIRVMKISFLIILCFLNQVTMQISIDMVQFNSLLATVLDVCFMLIQLFFTSVITPFFRCLLFFLGKRNNPLI